MSDIVLELKDCKIFENESLKIDKKITFVFGKNGTGKSTLTSLFQSQVKNHDTRVFQGFDGIVGEEKWLNAVILGEENNQIDKQIKDLEEEISEKKRNIDEIETETLQTESKPNNLWKNVHDKKKTYKDQEKKINLFYSESASKIKNLNKPQIAIPSYNTKNFQVELKNAKLLTDYDIKKYKDIIKTDIKMATKIIFPTIDFNSLLADTESLLAMKVEKKESIPEISGDVEKTTFAENGIKLHKANEKCSFCGNIISEDGYEKLQGYFSADDVQNLRDEIEKHINRIDSLIKQVENITLTIDDFYPQYIKDIDQIKRDFDLKKFEILSFLSEIKNLSDNKLKELFEKSEEKDIMIPRSFEEEISKYNQIVNLNNESDLKAKQEESRKELRYHEIKKLLDEFNYEEEKKQLDQLKLNYESSNAVLENENRKIKKIDEEIIILKRNIVNLQANTKNEELLAQEINKKLELYVNFELQYLEDDKKGYYQVKCKNTGEYRNITQLSSGEKNIIAFLYFIMKLKEVDNPKANLDKIVIFDDPMTSNDDTMQYLIIEELNQLIDSLGGQDKIIIMTHNNHFYLNVKYKYESYKKNIYLRLLSNGKIARIGRVTKSDEDFKTNYDALWKELEFIYNEAPSDSMILNPIRRIVETFTKFNSINKNEMLKHASGAAKLFNVNSHSIDDLEAELNGKDKKSIMKMMKKCFEYENAIKHFNKYRTIDLDS